MKRRIYLFVVFLLYIYISIYINVYLFFIAVFSKSKAEIWGWARLPMPA